MIAITEFDFFYLSYDEPNADENWAQVLDVIPWAKRVHGVKGFDAAHKECARQSTTDRFVTIDGDNQIMPEFLSVELNLTEKHEGCVLSWNAINAINGLTYGNGGLKLWPKKETLTMLTHEAAAQDKHQVDFCWDDKYIQLFNVYSTTYPNATPFQAFRVGFREGVKLSLIHGHKSPSPVIGDMVHEKNLQRLLVWGSVGADAENGVYAIYGTRLALHMMLCEDGFDYTKIRDFDWFNTVWKGASLTSAVVDASTRLGLILRRKTGLKLADLDAEQSEFFKAVTVGKFRVQDPLTTEVEVAS